MHEACALVAAASDMHVTTSAQLKCIRIGSKVGVVTKEGVGVTQDS